MKTLILTLALAIFNTNAFAQKETDESEAESEYATEEVTTGQQEISELDPHSPNVEQQLKEFDKAYEEQTGLSPFLPEDPLAEIMKGNCFRNSCKVWIDVDKTAQRIYLYLDGSLTYTWKTSTGKAGYTTPDFDRHPNGRIYDKYTSGKYPGGDYNGLGNMPYAVFISGGYAIHGTPSGNWSRLGSRASHGCIRLHPDNGYIFNRLVRKNGIYNVWVTVN